MDKIIGNSKEIYNTFLTEYRKIPAKLKIIDCFLVYSLLTAAIQLAYMVLVGTFPFNSFLAGFFCSGGFFVLTVCLRLQTNPNSQDFKHLSLERAFADYCLCMGLLFLVVWNFMG